MRDEQAALLGWYLAMVAVTTALERHAPEVLAELIAWESQHCDGETVASSDWPGWTQYLGPKPTFDRIPPTPKAVIPLWLRQLVFDRDSNTCRYCSATDNLSVDHIVAESRGGPTVLDNLQTLCRRCNSRKGTRLPSEVR